MKIAEKKILLVKRQGNWSLYLKPNFSMKTVFSIANEGSGASDSVFGDLSYFKRWLKQEMQIDSSIENNITQTAKELLNQKK